MASWTYVQSNYATGSGTSATITLTPTAVGNILVVGTTAYLSGNTPSTTGIATSGSGATSSWTTIGANHASVANTNIDFYMAATTVTTAAAITVTLTYSVSTSSSQTIIMEFEPSSGSTWAIDGSALAVDAQAGSTVFDMPSLTPTGDADLYVGIARDGGGNDWTATVTPSGYQVVINTGQPAMAMIYGANVTGQQDPTITNQTPNGAYDGYAVLLSLTGGATTAITVNASNTRIAGSLDLSGASDSIPVDFVVVGPGGETQTISATTSSSGQVTVPWVPQEAGEYSISAVQPGQSTVVSASTTIAS